MQAPSPFLNNLINLTLIDIADGKKVSNRLQAIKTMVADNESVSYDVLKRVSDIWYSLKTQSTRSQYWKNAKEYSDLWNIIAPKDNSHTFISKRAQSL